jgi:quinoprotein glucose dehydrogenase
MRTPAHLASVIEFGLRHDLASHIREHVWQLVSLWAEPSPRDPVHGLWRALEPRPREEVAATVRSALPQIIAAGPAGALGLLAAAELGVSEAQEPLQRVAMGEEYAPDVRARALAALSKADDSVVRSAVTAGLSSTDPSIRSAARHLMFQRFPDQAVPELMNAVESGVTRERQTAITMLSQLRAPAAQLAVREWLERLESGASPPELQLEILDAALQSKDPGLIERAKRFQEQLAGKEALEQFGGSLYGGDAEQGGRIFHENTALACRRCHSVMPGKKLVGPNLADVGKRLPRQELLESIVKPNEKIAEGFQTTVLQLDTGKVVSGILRSENETSAVLVDPDGKEIAVDAATIEDRFEGLSAMPEGLEKQMTPRDLRDLVEFLSQQRNTTKPIDGAPGHGAAGE